VKIYVLPLWLLAGWLAAVSFTFFSLHLRRREERDKEEIQPAAAQIFLSGSND
jgi:hypothetical protein